MIIILIIIIGFRSGDEGLIAITLSKVFYTGIDFNETAPVIIVDSDHIIDFVIIRTDE